jgi:hypothetical protein
VNVAENDLLIRQALTDLRVLVLDRSRVGGMESLVMTTKSDDSRREPLWDANSYAVGHT